MSTATTTIEPTSFAAEVAQRLSTLGASQNFLADFACLSHSELSKILNGIRPQESTRLSQIRTALDDLEELVKTFHPLRLDFHDAAAVKEWQRAPRLPHLFNLLGIAQLQRIRPDEWAAMNQLSLKCARADERIAESKQRTQKLWLDFLENPNGQ